MKNKTTIPCVNCGEKMIRLIRGNTSFLACPVCDKDKITALKKS